MIFQSHDSLIILVVDDSKAIREGIETRLRSQGYNVAIAKDGEEALELIVKIKVDLIILDIILPGIDGFQVCEIVRETSKVPIILVSSLSRVQDRLKGLNAGADDYI